MGSANLDLFLTAADITALADAHEDEYGEESELVVVSNRIAGQFVEVLAGVAGQLFAGRPEGPLLDEMGSALSSLRRLAVASGDAGHLSLIDEADAALQRFAEVHRTGKGRSRYLDHLRAWLPRYGAHLGGEAEKRLSGLVTFDPNQTPLLQELHQIKGIGPRRLQRLYAAGLFSVESVAGAKPEDIASVTGLPLSLAETVVERTREWLELHRQQVVLDMRRRVSEFVRVLQELPREEHPELHRAAQSALEDMRRILTTFDQGRKT